MKLYQTASKSNSEIIRSVAESSHSSIVSSGNTVPNWWYHQILSCGSKPDLVGITVLAELLALHHANGGKEYSNGYSYLEQKLNFTRYQLRNCTLRLHKSGLVTRSLKTVLIRGRKFANELHLKLNVDALVKLMPSDIVEENNNSDSDFEFRDPLGKTMSEFHPISLSEAKALQARSGRDFDIHFINQLLLKVSSKYPDHKFLTKDAFLNYMSKLLKNEMRDASRVSNDSFKFKARENEELQKETYLQSVKNNTDITSAATESIANSKADLLKADNSTWSRVRLHLIAVYGEMVDKHWFSKLIASEDLERRTLTLKAPSDFYKDYIHQNYGALIERICLEENFQLVEV